MGIWIEGYQVQCTNAAGKKWAAAKLTAANKYVFTGLGAGGNYKFRVRFYMRDQNGKAQFGKWTTISVPTLPKATKLSSVASAKKAFTAKWAKVSGVTGYQIQYSTNAKYTGAKVKAVKGAAKYSLAVKGLKGGAKYYVRIRTFKTIGGKNHFSAWSASKAVTKKK